MNDACKPNQGDSYHCLLIIILSIIIIIIINLFVYYFYSFLISFFPFMFVYACPKNWIHIIIIMIGDMGKKFFPDCVGVVCVHVHV